MEHVKWW